MAKGLGVITSRYPELKSADPQDILKWAAELVRLLAVRDKVISSFGYDWEVSNLSAKVKAIDASASSTATVREVLASLIQELKDSGNLGG